MERDKALELLRQNHRFPGPFVFRVVVRPPDAAATVLAITAAAGERARFIDTEERPSSKGTYVALHITLEVDQAETVLEIYEVVGKLPDVLASL